MSHDDAMLLDVVKAACFVQTSVQALTKEAFL
jgi:hypothetical protein